MSRWRTVWEYVSHYGNPRTFLPRLAHTEWDENWAAWPHCNGQAGCWMHYPKVDAWCQCACRWCRIGRRVRSAFYSGAVYFGLAAYCAAFTVWDYARGWRLEFWVSLTCTIVNIIAGILMRVLRRIRRRNNAVRAYTQAMRDGRWKLGEPIQVAADDEILDGQHRLTTIIATNPGDVRNGPHWWRWRRHR